VEEALHRFERFQLGRGEAQGHLAEALGRVSGRSWYEP